VILQSDVNVYRLSVYQLAFTLFFFNMLLQMLQCVPPLAKMVVSALLQTPATALALGGQGHSVRPQVSPRMLVLLIGALHNEVLMYKYSGGGRSNANHVGCKSPHDLYQIIVCAFVLRFDNVTCT
jgi:hypothetical protein